MPQSPPALLTPAEAADLLRVNTRTLANWAEKGRIERVLLPGGHSRYRRAELERIAAGTDAGKAAS